MFYCTYTAEGCHTLASCRLPCAASEFVIGHVVLLAAALAKLRLDSTPMKDGALAGLKLESAPTKARPCGDEGGRVGSLCFNEGM